MAIKPVRPRARVEAPAVTGAVGLTGETVLVQLFVGMATPGHSGPVQPEPGAVVAPGQLGPGQTAPGALEAGGQLGPPGQTAPGALEAPGQPGPTQTLVVWPAARVEVSMVTTGTTVTVVAGAV